MVKSTAQTKFNYTQHGAISLPLIIGGIIALVVIFFIASGSFKFSASINKPATNGSSNTSPQQTQQNTPATSQPESKPKTYQNEKNGFSLEYPESWSLKENPAAGYVTGFFSPQESNSDNYKENLLVKIIDISTQPKITLQELADLWENQTKKAEGTNFTVTDRTSSTLGGENAKDIVYIGKVDKIDLKGMVRITLKNGKAYIFQYNAEKPSYDKFLPDITKILASVKF